MIEEQQIVVAELVATEAKKSQGLGPLRLPLGWSGGGIEGTFRLGERE